MKKYNTTINGITCKACVMLITMELKEYSAIDDIEIDVTSGETSISYDETQIAVEKIISIIKEAWYTPQ